MSFRAAWLRHEYPEVTIIDNAAVAAEEALTDEVMSRLTAWSLAYLLHHQAQHDQRYATALADLQPAPGIDAVVPTTVFYVTPEHDHRDVAPPPRLRDVRRAVAAPRPGPRAGTALAATS